MNANAKLTVMKRLAYQVTLVLAAAGSLYAQSGAISGNVRADDETPVSGAVVTATRDDGSIVRRNVSGIDGRYRLGLLPPGTYIVEARRLGFVHRRTPALP